MCSSLNPMQLKILHIIAKTSSLPWIELVYYGLKSDNGEQSTGEGHDAAEAQHHHHYQWLGAI